MVSTWGRPYFGRYCCTTEGKVSFSSRLDLAAMVSSTNDDLPEPETPVTTVIWCLGILRLRFLRLFSVAPRMMMQSFSMKVWSVAYLLLVPMEM